MSEIRIINLGDWVNQVSGDPVRYLERQATEIFLHAIGLAPSLNKTILLKGGTLMGVMYESPRQTADLDFTSALPANSEAEHTIKTELDGAFPRASAKVGRPDVVCRVQSIERKPRKNNFAGANFPALIIKIAYAQRDTSQMRALEKGNCSQIIQADISFNEPVSSVEHVGLRDGDTKIVVYSLNELVAEKLRALIQQKIRGRNRRQDVYDLALLIKQSSFDRKIRLEILTTFKRKCEARGIMPNVDSLSDPEVARRAKVEWDSLKLEIGSVPQFEESFSVVENFYRSLW